MFLTTLPFGGLTSKCLCCLLSAPRRFEINQLGAGMRTAQFLRNAAEMVRLYKPRAIIKTERIKGSSIVAGLPGSFRSMFKMNVVVVSQAARGRMRTASITSQNTRVQLSKLMDRLGRVMRGILSTAGRH